MTDDSAALKSALRSVWPQTRQLLCHFHVGQAEWRWLTSKANGVPSDERQALMKAFQKVFCFHSHRQTYLEKVTKALEPILMGY